MSALRALLACVASTALLGAAPDASAASRFFIEGRGFGHGVGMSQYGAHGFARQGIGYRAILSHYYRGTTLSRVGRRAEVRVLLRGGGGEVAVRGATRAGKARLSPRRTYVARRRGAAVELREAGGRSLGTAPALRLDGGPEGVTLVGAQINGVSDGRYRGALEVRPDGGGVNAVNAVALEDYVRGVVSAESPPTWPADALRAQAVAARTYAITSNVNGNGFQQYPDTRSQVYRGVAAETATTDAAVRATRNEVVTVGRRPVTTFFFSTSGGRTENAEYGFVGSRPRSWLKSVSDPYERSAPQHEWDRRRLTMSQAGAKLGDLVRGRFRGIEVVKRGVSPRVVTAYVLGTKGRRRASGPTLKARLELPDTWAFFTTISSEAAAPGILRVAGPRPAGKLVGQVLGGRAGALVDVQRRRGGRWRTVGRGRLGGRGGYRLGVAARGTHRVRYAGLPGPPIRVRSSSRRSGGRGERSLPVAGRVHAGLR